MRFTLLILSLFLAASPVGAEETGPLGPGARLPDYVRYGLKNSPQLRARYAQWQAAAHDIGVAKGWPDPEIMYTNMIEEMMSIDGPQENMIEFTQMIPWMGKIRFRAEAASQEAEAARYQYEAARLELIARIAQAYFDYAFTGRDAEITAQNARLLERLEEVARQKQRAGGALIDTLRIGIEEGQTLDRMQAIEREKDARAAVLAAAVGLDPEQPLPMPTLADAGLSEAIPKWTDEHPTLAGLNAEAKAAGERAKLAQRNRIPDPTIGFNFVDMGMGGDDAIGVMLGFRVPIGQRKYLAERDAALSRQDAKVAELTEARNRLSADYESALSELRRTKASLSRYRSELLPAAQEMVKVTEDAYRTDRASLLDLIDAERTHLELERTYWRSVAEAHTALNRLRTIAGQDEESPPPLTDP